MLISALASQTLIYPRADLRVAPRSLDLSMPARRARFASRSLSMSGAKGTAATKFIVVTGGVISGIGKGVTASSIGVCMKMLGARVTAVKIDPYLNVDAGTMSPLEHGECFVLDDGGETDLDLGNYERFLDVILGSDSNLTTGKIYKRVIERERAGEYLGKTVQIIPHITNEIMDRIHSVARSPTDESDEAPDICMIELGGTIGDIESMPFVEALRQLQLSVGRQVGHYADFCLHPHPSPLTPHHPSPLTLTSPSPHPHPCAELLPGAREHGAYCGPEPGRAEDQADAAQRQGATQPRPHPRLHRLPLQGRGAHHIVPAYIRCAPRRRCRCLHCPPCLPCSLCSLC